MTQPADTFSTYGAIGNREDLSDIITMISPTETPFMSGIAKTTASSTLVEWQTDTLAAAVATNAVIEGDDATTDASVATVRLNNQTQISDKVPRVTGTQRSMDSAGRSDEMSYQIMKRGGELKRDVEATLLANQAKVVGDNSTARVTAGIETWIATNATVGDTGAVSSGDGTDLTSAGTPRAFTEDLLQEVLASAFDEGGNPDMIMLGSFNKQAMSAFTGGSTRNVEATDKTLVTAIDVYVSDFGQIKVMANRFQEADTALALEMDKWKMATLRDFQSNPLAKTGDTDREQLLVEYALVSMNEAASAAVYGLTVS